MHIIGYIMSYIFGMYMFGIVDVYSFLYKLGQSCKIKLFKKYVHTTLCNGGSIIYSILYHQPVYSLCSGLLGPILFFVKV